MSEDLTLDDEETATASAELSGTPTPSVIAEAGVKILDTPTGFLRVRASIGGSEIGQVTPGETYPLVEEKSGWFAITFEEGKTGWISSDYAEKVNTTQ